MNDPSSAASALICTECGSVNDGDATFCGGCGAYLEWDGERARPEEPAPAEVPVAMPEPPRPTLIDRVRSGLGIDDGSPASTSGVDAAGEPGDPRSGDGDPTRAASGTVEPTAPAAPRAAPVNEATVVRPEPARRPTPALPVPVRQPAAVKPGAEASPQPRRRSAPVDELKPRPGETICGQCGAGNAQDRKFCRRCGRDLAGAAVVPPPPWWRRLFQRTPRTPVAGTRPVLRRRSRAPRRLVVLVLVAVALLASWRFAGPWAAGIYDSFRDRVSGASQRVEPTAMVSSSSAPGHGAALARDGKGETYWAPKTPGQPAGQYVEARFDTPFRLVQLQYLNGSSRDQGKYLKTRRPSEVVLTITRSDRTSRTIPLTLRDDSDHHEIGVGINDVTSVRLTIKTIKKPVGDSQRTLVALGEIAFFTRS